MESFLIGKSVDRNGEISSMEVIDMKVDESGFNNCDGYFKAYQNVIQFEEVSQWHTCIFNRRLLHYVYVDIIQLKRARKQHRKI